MRHSRIVLGLGLAATALCAVAPPALGQDLGGRSLTLAVRQGLEAARNPDQVPGGRDSIVVSNTDLSFGIATRTRNSELELVLDARLRAEAGDGAADGIAVDRPGARLSYSHIAPGARIDASLAVTRQDIEYLRAIELVELVDGTLVLPDDLDDLQGEGTRTDTSYRFAASFGGNRPFGWGVALSGSELGYRDVTSGGLVDSRSHSLVLAGRFDLTPVLRLDTRLGHALRDTGTTSWTGTTSLDLGLTHVRPADGALRARLGFAFPEDGADRMTLTGGLTHAPTRQSRIGFDLGATFIEDGDAQLVGRLDYRAALLPTLALSADLSRQVGETTDGSTVLSTAAQVALALDLSKLGGLSFGATYAEQDRLRGDGDVSELTLSVQYDRRLAGDWTLSVGAAQTLRDTDTTRTATSERLFLTVGRSWTGRF